MNYFDTYTSSYDMLDADINYKYHHSYRVMEAMELLSKKLNLNDKDTHLAKVIGLLHDIGRFEQDKLYDSFKDSEFDHGDYGVKVLKDTKLLDQTNIDKSDYEVVYKAVDNHNQFEIDKGLNERELFFAKLIRDADKLDILYALGNKEVLALQQDNEEISKELEKDFFNHKSGNIKDVKSLNDSLVIQFGYIYDINFKETFEIIQEEKYYDKIYERITRKDIFTKYLEYTNKFILERADENVR